MARKAKTEPQKPPWAMTEEEKAALAQAQAQEAADEAAKPPQPPKPKSKYTFGKLWEVQCPFDERVFVSFHVGTRWGMFQAPVKDDDGKGSLRRTRLLCPYWRGLENIIHPLLETPLSNPDPDDLDSYLVVSVELYHLWGDTFFTWLFKDGWEQAVAEVGGTTSPN